MFLTVNRDIFNISLKVWLFIQFNKNRDSFYVNFDLINGVIYFNLLIWNRILDSCLENDQVRFYFLVVVTQFEHVRNKRKYFNLMLESHRLNLQVYLLYFIIWPHFFPFKLKYILFGLLLYHWPINDIVKLAF